MKRIPTALTVMTMAALPLGLFGCGGDDPEPAAAAPAKGTAVKMIDSAFEPKEIAVEVGDTVTWTNDGRIAHTATATEGADFDSGTVDSGGTFEWTAKKAGTVSYVCTFHPGMEGTITVR